MIKKLGFLSYSNHLTNKVIPSIKRNKNIIPSAILSLGNKVNNNQYFQNAKLYKKKVKFFLDKSYDTVYISSVTANHFKDCMLALKYKKNVICEKPICKNTNQLKKILSLAKKNKLKVDEVYQYCFHPLFYKIKKILKSKVLGRVIYIDSAFNVPIIDKKNFRFKKNLGGSALLDVGVYPLSTLIFLLKTIKYKIVNCKIFYKKNINVDIIGEANIKLNKTKLKYKWGYSSPYQNYIKIIGSKGTLNAKFIFSKKISQTGNISIAFKKKRKKIKIKRSNQINNAFNFYLNRIKSKNYNKKSIMLLNLLTQIKKESKKIFI
jgi:NDP-hexose-3-ketoreductase